mgnify:CR=1 FL=1
MKLCYISILLYNSFYNIICHFFCQKELLIKFYPFMVSKSSNSIAIVILKVRLDGVRLSKSNI